MIGAVRRAVCFLMVLPACGAGTCKAIIALSRKFLVIIYKRLKNNWVFEDFPSFALVKTHVMHMAS